MVKIHSSASNALSQATEFSFENIKRLQSDFARAKEAFEHQLLHDLQESSAKTQSYIGKLSETLTSALGATLSKLRATASATESQMASLNDVS